jgi:hypothetical protein
MGEKSGNPDDNQRLVTFFMWRVFFISKFKWRTGLCRKNTENVKFIWPPLTAFAPSWG